MNETWKKYEEKIYNTGKDDGYNQGKDDGYNLGKDDGFNLGEGVARNSIALKMLQQNMDSQLIMQMTSISQDEFSALQKQIEQ